MDSLIYTAFGIFSFLIGLYAAVSFTHEIYIYAGSKWQLRCRESSLEDEFDRNGYIYLNKHSMPQIQISVFKSIVVLLIPCLMTVALFGGMLSMLMGAFISLVSDGLTADATYEQAFILGSTAIIGYFYGRGQILSTLLQVTYAEIGNSPRHAVSPQEVLKTRLKRKAQLGQG